MGEGRLKVPASNAELPLTPTLSPQAGRGRRGGAGILFSCHPGRAEREPGPSCQELSAPCSPWVPDIRLRRIPG